MSEFKRGQMVVTRSGFMGLLDRRYLMAASSSTRSKPKWRWIISLGSAGPLKISDENKLRWASDREICVAGLEGVGRTPNPLDPA
jgi:hypothetical protein